MLTYNFEERKNKTLYEYLYDCIKNDILCGQLTPGTKLPSKREMAKDNGISVKTVMNAYEQLVVEGYLDAIEKKGYFVADAHTGMQNVIGRHDSEVKSIPSRIYKEEEWFADFGSNTIMYSKFPFSAWKKTIRNVLSEYDEELIKRGHYLGVELLRKEIADYLHRARGMNVSYECIVIGAGIEYLYAKIINLLPKYAIYAIENPGNKKITQAYREFGVKWKWVEMDEKGVQMSSLRATNADIIHVSPEHHFPLGTVMPTVRRQELLEWANESEERYIIENDYDCEFRYGIRPIPSLESMDRNNNVIYMNTFHKTLSPAIRISYMILPPQLMEKFAVNNDFYTFYTNSASSLEQYALAKFIQNGGFERHLSRMKKYYQAEGEKLIRIIKQSQLLPLKDIKGGKCGTHLLLKMDTSMTDDEIKEAARHQGIHLNCLSDYCRTGCHQYDHILIINYSELDETTLQEAIRRLENVFTQW